MLAKEYLNDLLERDRKALERLLFTRVPCAREFAESPHIKALGPPYTVSGLGLLNGLLEALGEPIVEAVGHKGDGSFKADMFVERPRRLIL